MLAKLEPLGPEAGTALSAALECDARGKGMLSKDGVELTMWAVLTISEITQNNQHLVICNPHKILRLTKVTPIYLVRN